MKETVGYIKFTVAGISDFVKQLEEVETQVQKLQELIKQLPSIGELSIEAETYKGLPNFRHDELTT